MKPKERYRSSFIILVKTSTTILLLLLLNPTRKNILQFPTFPLLTYLQLTHPSLAPAAAYLSMELYHDTHSSSRSCSVMTMRMKEWMVWLPTLAFVLTLHAMQFSLAFSVWCGWDISIHNFDWLTDEHDTHKRRKSQQQSRRRRSMCVMMIKSGARWNWLWGWNGSGSEWREWEGNEAVECACNKGIWSWVKVQRAHSVQHIERYI